LLSGSATDPNTGPLLVLLALAFWPAAAPLARLRRAGALTDRHQADREAIAVGPMRAVSGSGGRPAQAQAPGQGEDGTGADDCQPRQR
jgi:hypothetical protein